MNTVQYKVHSESLQFGIGFMKHPDALVRAESESDVSFPNPHCRIGSQGREATRPDCTLAVAITTIPLPPVQDATVFDHTENRTRCTLFKVTSHSASYSMTDSSTWGIAVGYGTGNV